MQSPKLATELPDDMQVLIAEARRLRRRRRFGWVALAVAVAVATAVALPLTLLPGSSPPPLRLLGTYGRVVPTANGPRCRGAAASAASAVQLPTEVGPRAPHLQPDPGGLPNPVTVGAAGKLGGQLPKLFPDQYAGITLSDDNSTINVYEVCSSPNLTRFAVSTAPVNAVRFHFVPNTFRELNRAFDELMSGNAALEHLVGVMVAGYGVDVPANLVNVQVINLTHQQLGQIVHVSPPDLLQVQGITKSQERGEL